MAALKVQRRREAGRRRWRIPLYRTDMALLAAAGCDWRKVARLVGDVWQWLPERWQAEIGVRLLTRRVARLVALGKLEVAGDVRKIGFSEVRLRGAAAVPPPRPQRRKHAGQG